MKAILSLLIVFSAIGFFYADGQERQCKTNTLCILPNDFLKYKVTTDGLPDSILTVTFGNQWYDRPNMIEVRETIEPSNPNEENWDTYVLNTEDGTFTQAYPYGEWVKYDYVYPHPYVADYSWINESITGTPSKIEESGKRTYNGILRDVVFVEGENYKHIVDSKTGVLLSGLHRSSYSGGQFVINYTLIDTNIPDLNAQAKQVSKTNCKGTKLCIVDKVKKVVDGDTIYVKNHKIRLSLTDTPERTEKGFKDALLFTKRLCPIGSTVTVDQDDKQPLDKYKRIVGKVICSGKVLNAELLYAKHANISKLFCSKSEFSSESWAKKYGC